LPQLQSLRTDPERHNYLADWLMQAARDFSVAPTQMYPTQWGPTAAQAVHAEIQENFGWKVSVARYLKRVEFWEPLGDSD
jgi:hypothetical protein